MTRVESVRKSLMGKNSVNAYDLELIQTPQEYLMALSSYRNKKALLNEINGSIEAVNQFIRKKELTIAILYQQFAIDDTLTLLTQTVGEKERMFYENVKAILADVSEFDEQQYEKLSGAVGSKKKDGCEAYEKKIKEVMKLRKENDILVLEIEKILAAVSRMVTSEEANDLSKLTALIEL